jgi:radical SAM superfamily enzyme YgiQ (UPF0313 family)
MWTTTYTMRDVSRVCDEIELYMARYAATDFHFQDLTAIVNKKWILAFGEELMRRRLRITWQLPSGTRAEAIDDDVCRMLAATGCKNIAYAPESGSDHIREVIGKRVKLDKMMASIRAAVRHKLSLSCFFVIGFPQESRQTLRETLRLIRRLAWMGVHDVGVSKFVAYPGSVIFRELLAAGKLRLTDDFFLMPNRSYAYREREASYAEAFTPNQLTHWMLWLFVNFYVLSFLRHPARTARTLLRAVFTGREDTRYAKWFCDMFRTRRRWRRAARERARAAEHHTPVAPAPARYRTRSRTQPLPVLSPTPANVR